MIHFTTLGVAWGFLMVVYLVIPGDLAGSYSQERYYALATVLPLVIYMSLSALPSALNVTLPINVLSPVLSMILFLSLVPVLLARETLPETEIRKRELNEHIEKVGKMVQKSEEED